MRFARVSARADTLGPSRRFEGRAFLLSLGCKVSFLSLVGAPCCARCELASLPAVRKAGCVGMPSLFTAPHPPGTRMRPCTFRHVLPSVTFPLRLHECEERFVPKHTPVHVRYSLARVEPFQPECLLHCPSTHTPFRLLTLLHARRRHVRG